MSTLNYKNQSAKEILSQQRNVDYANFDLKFGFENTTLIVLIALISVSNVLSQADVFAREVFTHKSSLNLKRVLGQYEQDWQRLLCEAYIYDRLKCFYYGFYSTNAMNFPKGTYSFPGNILLANILKDKNYVYQIDDNHPYSLYVQIGVPKTIRELFQPFFDICPDLEEGMSDNPNVFVYSNTTYETILTGLKDQLKYLESNSKTKAKADLFQIAPLSDEVIPSVLYDQDNNPVTNSYLNEDGSRFYFILGTENSKDTGLRFNESLYLPRAIGLVKQENVYSDENPLYKMVRRNNESDPMTREDVFAVTGLKSDKIPYSKEQISRYLGIELTSRINMNSNQTSNNNGGTNINTP